MAPEHPMSASPEAGVATPNGGSAPEERGHKPQGNSAIGWPRRVGSQEAQIRKPRWRCLAVSDEGVTLCSPPRRTWKHLG